jgi:cell division protein FtsZ
MVDRRQFIQTGLSVLASSALATPIQTLPLVDPTVLSPGPSRQTVPAAIENAFTVTPQIKVMGVGGGGTNAARHMIDSGVTGISYVFVNTDTEALNRVATHKTIQLHRKTLSATTKLGRCRETAELAANDIRATLDGTHLLFITVGLGGGTGTEAAPVIARIAKEMGIETVALVTLPFSWEGVRRRRYADIGLAELQSHVDTVIVLPNDKLLDDLGSDATLDDAFYQANEVIKNTVVGMAKIIMPEPENIKLTSVINSKPDQEQIVAERALASLFLKTGVF